MGLQKTENALFGLVDNVLMEWNVYSAINLFATIMTQFAEEIKIQVKVKLIVRSSVNKA